MTKRVDRYHDASTKEVTDMPNDAEIQIKPNEGSGETLVDYSRIVVGVALDLDRLAAHANTLGLTEAAKLSSDVGARLSERRFTVAVVGEFKRGKSTFINALLGAEALPTDVLPCSATPNRVTHAMKEAVRIEFCDGRIENIPFAELSDYVTKLTPDSEKRAATIREAVIAYPTPYCANNVDVIDTPGLNDDQTMTNVTLAVLPQTDTAIMVIMAQAPFSQYERDFLENKLLTADLGRVIFVVNAIDRIDPEDVDRLLDHVKGRIKRFVGERTASIYGKDSPEYEVYLRKIGEPKVYGLSASQALKGKLRNDAKLLEASRFTAFERDLGRYLVEKRGIVALQGPLSRVISAARDITGAIALERNTIRMSREEFDSAQLSAATEIDRLRSRKQEELAAIGRRAAATRTDALAMLQTLPDELITAARHVIATIPIEAAELNSLDKLQSRVGTAVSDELRRVSERRTTQVQDMVDHALIREVERLDDFTHRIDGVQTQLMDQFNVVRDSSELAYGSTGQAAGMAAVAVLTGLGGIYSGFREAGYKGAALGAATSFGTCVLAGVVMGLVSLPVTLPIVVLVGIASIFPSQWAARFFFREMRVDRFRERYGEALEGKLRGDLAQAEIATTAGQQVAGAFERLGLEVERQAEAVLRDAEAQLAKLREGYERQSTLDEGRTRQLDQIVDETRQIADRAAKLSDHLRDTSEI
jgi:hypothetical protein